MKLIIALLTMTATLTLSAAPSSISSTFKNWPAFSLQNEFATENTDMIKFEEADFDKINEEVEQKNAPMIPTTKKRQFSKMVSINNPDIKWRISMRAVAGNRYSGFSQSIGGTTMLIKDELWLDAEVTHMKYNFKDKYYDRYYGDGDKYRVDTTLHWQPTDNFSMHLGLGSFFDK